MDEHMKELIAIGASAAVNCHPCIEHHLAQRRRLGLDEEEIRAATEVGMAVGRGAAAKTRAKVDNLLAAASVKTESGGGCGCGA
jgi:AhpD family alkylhydroperoxidase